MIVKVNDLIRENYEKRLSTILSIINQEIEHRKRVAYIETARQERAELSNFPYECTNHICYLCLYPLQSIKGSVTFVEDWGCGVNKTYFHLRCVKQKV